MTDTEIKASHVPANNAFGQNGFQGPSSVMPGKPQPTASLKVTPDDPVKDVLAAQSFTDQERKISSEQAVPAGHGMRNRIADAVASIPSKLNYRDK